MATPQVHRAQALSQTSKKCNSAGRQEESAGGRPLGRPSKDNWCCIAGRKRGNDPCDLKAIAGTGSFKDATASIIFFRKSRKSKLRYF